MKPNKVIPIFTSSIEIVIPSHAANNTLCVFIETAPPGGGPPPHRHDREDEVFPVLEGVFEFYADGVWSPFSVVKHAYRFAEIIMRSATSARPLGA
jgi:mannose-6-phosphate isomerase-like protein (cupin superfamily)